MTGSGATTHLDDAHPADHDSRGVTDSGVASDRDWLISASVRDTPCPGTASALAPRRAPSEAQEIRSVARVQGQPELEDGEEQHDDEDGHHHEVGDGRAAFGPTGGMTPRQPVTEDIALWNIVR